jgi:hypothetical protein
MIIKSLSRATKSFEALYRYLTRDEDSLLNAFNLYADPHSKEEIVQAFLDNAKHLKNARGKNYLYHEIISLTPNTLALQEQQHILTDLVSKYISLRAQNHLTFTALHQDKDHLHIHLMISANELEGSKRVRLSKKEFSTIQKELEQYVNTTYPQLGKTTHYNKDLNKIKSKKELLKSTLHDLFKNSRCKEDFKRESEELKLEFYTRGKTVGVISEGKKYRLKTLGLLEEYENTVKKLAQEKTEPKQAHTKEDKKVASNENETKINSRREQMKKARESKYTEARENK